jgi:hypothetical protein
MERVLDAYCEPPDADVPLVCMDEASKELHGDVVPPLPMTPADPAAGHAGTPTRRDDKYERHGTRPLFLFVAPHLGWRRVSAAHERRTRVEWASEVRRLLTVDFPLARKVRLVCDNLNTHDVASLYEAFPASEAHALAARLELVHTPRNGSWLNVAEIELAALSTGCLGERRFADAATLEREVSAWQAERNEEGSKVTWQFTTADARVKLRHLYPQV